MPTLAFKQTTNIDTAQSLSRAVGGFPEGATSALIQAEGADVRWRDDNQAPTASVGHLLADGESFVFEGDLGRVKVISVTAGGKLNVSFYK